MQELLISNVAFAVEAEQYFPEQLESNRPAKFQMAYLQVGSNKRTLTFPTTSPFLLNLILPLEQLKARMLPNLDAPHEPSLVQ